MRQKPRKYLFFRDTLYFLVPKNDADFDTTKDLLNPNHFNWRPNMAYTAMWDRQERFTLNGVFLEDFSALSTCISPRSWRSTIFRGEAEYEMRTWQRLTLTTFGQRDFAQVRTRQILGRGPRHRVGHVF